MAKNTWIFFAYSKNPWIECIVFMSWGGRRISPSPSILTRREVNRPLTTHSNVRAMEVTGRGEEMVRKMTARRGKETRCNETRKSYVRQIPNFREARRDWSVVGSVWKDEWWGKTNKTSVRKPVQYVSMMRMRLRTTTSWVCTSASLVVIVVVVVICRECQALSKVQSALHPNKFKRWEPLARKKEKRV